MSYADSIIKKENGIWKAGSDWFTACKSHSLVANFIILDSRKSR